jgi:hypothetical protein
MPETKTVLGKPFVYKINYTQQSNAEAGDSCCESAQCKACQSTENTRYRKIVVARRRLLDI